MYKAFSVELNLNLSIQAYLYQGDRLTDVKYKGKMCNAVLHPDGKWRGFFFRAL
jgi:hypothetical protein